MNSLARSSALPVATQNVQIAFELELACICEQNFDYNPPSGKFSLRPSTVSSEYTELTHRPAPYHKHGCPRHDEKTHACCEHSRRAQLRSPFDIPGRRAVSGDMIIGGALHVFDVIDDPHQRHWIVSGKLERFDEFLESDGFSEPRLTVETTQRMRGQRTG